MTTNGRRVSGTSLVAATLAAMLTIAACSSFSDATPPPSPGADASSDAGPVDTGIVVPDGDSPLAEAGPCDAGGRACDARYVFVTPQPVSAVIAPAATNSETAVLTSADRICKAQADAQTGYPLLRGRTWKAWLCTPSIPAASRVAVVDARWIRPDGVEVFATTKDVLDGVLRNPISTSNARVWTGCGSRGENANVPTCDVWASTDNSGLTGLADAVDDTWSNAGEASCELQGALYCFEAEK